MFWICTVRGSGVALPHTHLQRYYQSILKNQLSLLVFEHEATWYRMNPAHWHITQTNKQSLMPFWKSIPSKACVYLLLLYTSTCRTYSDGVNIDTHMFDYLTITFIVWIAFPILKQPLGLIFVRSFYIPENILLLLGSYRLFLSFFFASIATAY